MPQENNKPDTTYLDSLAVWIQNHQSPIGQIDVSFDGYITDQYNRPVIFQEEQPETTQIKKPKDKKVGRLNPFWTWFLVGVAVLAVVSGIYYIRVKAN